MKLTRYEMESIVLYNAEEQTATLYTRGRVVSGAEGCRQSEVPSLQQMMVEKNKAKDD